MDVQVQEADEWKTYTEKEDVEQACLEENVRKFTQAHNSPFYTELHPTLDPCATGPVSQAILQGQRIPVGNTHVAAFIRQCRQQIPPFDIPQDSDSHSTSWKRMREYTSSGLSGLHFGLFMAAATD
jgi:hypothetical protein